MVSTDVDGFAASMTLPMRDTELVFKCSKCKVFVPGVNICPICGETDLPEMCSYDNRSREKCTHHIGTIAYCPECGNPICPVCHSHDVVQISRVTGYLSSTSGWNAGKIQELKDRQRTNI